MKLKSYYFTIGILMAVLLGCSPCSNKEIASQEDQTLITSDNFSRIAGMQWILQKMIVDGSEYPLTGEMPFVKFETDGKVNGFASINRFFGAIEINPQGQVKWSEALGSTRMAGPEELMKQEDAFLKALPRTEQLTIKGIYLYAYSRDKQIEYIFYVPVE